ncbi:MAG TPA: SDR family NAD(P)-dependent oxidoreductase, partial [Sorangium sp.]|nr:SDR family NAD(P)-dependent oxidoreductase [Sorangium sp.]
ALAESGHALFVEMSPHPILVPSVEETLRAERREGTAVGSLRRGQDERPALLASLGALWVQGYATAWERLFPAGGRRVPLPTYAWQRERYWVETPATTGAAGEGRRAPTSGHPLLGEVQTLSTQTSTHLWETTLDLQRLPWLSDRRVQGEVVFPGAGYLEMALASGAEVLERIPLQLTDVVFTRPLVLSDDAAVTVQLVMTEESPDRLRAEIASRPPGPGRAAWTAHARGTVQRAERAGAEATLDPIALRARLGAATPAQTAHAATAARGLEYGPAFRGLEELWRGHGEALGRVRLPGAAGAASAYQVHPALLDACLQVVAGTFDDGEIASWVPVEVASLRLLRRPPGELWCHARLTRADAAHRRSADLLLVDAAGAPVAEIQGLVIQRLATGTSQREQDDWFLEHDWELAAVPAPTIFAGRFLLLGAEGGVGSALRAALEAAGHVVVHAPAETSPAGVRARLAGAFGAQAPTAVVHLGSLEGDAPRLDAEAVERALVCGCDSVLATVQALAGAGRRDASRLWLVTRGAQAVGDRDVAAAQAPLLGLGRVVAMEHPELRCARVDLDPARPAGEIQALLAELLADEAEEEVALRGEERRVARLASRAERREGVEPARGRPLRLEIKEAQPLGKPALAIDEPGSREPSPSGITVRADGSYLLTGGLGGLGLSVARWLAKKGAGHLVLVGRSGATSADQRAAIAALEAHGTRVTVARADVADREQIERVLREVAASGMPLRGVIHAAGLLDDGLLLQQTPARFRAVMAPKVRGALHLHTLTREASLDFFVLYASGAGLLGTPGQGNYAAANAFLDALAHHRRTQGLPSLSIDWGAFSEVGLAAAQENRGARLVSRGMRSLTTDEGLAALERLIDGGHTQVGVMPLDLRQWAQFYPAAASSRRLSRLWTAHRAGAGRPAGEQDLRHRLAAAEPGAQAALLQAFLRAQISQVLRVREDRLDVNTPLTRLGMDSLMGLELRNRLEASLGLRLSATLIWQHPTIAALTQLLIDERLRAALAFGSSSPTTSASNASSPIDEEHEEGTL